MITTRNLSFAYDEKRVIENLSFHLSKGEMCTVMGLNGSGKSTLLKLISKLLPLKEGEILIHGKSISSYNARTMAQNIAYVPQHQDIIFDFSVYDTVMMGRNPYQGRWETESAEDREIVAEVLDQCNLTFLKDRMLTQLSGGEMQRTLIARAMAQQSPVMLLDEPLSNLDIVHKYEIMDILANLNRTRQSTIVLILHDFPFAKLYTNKTLLLESNHEYFFGETTRILTPDIIKKVFHLSEEYQIDPLGNITKKAIFAFQKGDDL